MRNIFVLVGIVSIVFTGSDVHALVVGDEITIGESYTAIPFSKFQLGGMAELVLDKKLESDTGSNKLSFEGDRFLFKPTVSVFENLDIYVKVGIGKDEVEDSSQNLKVESEVGVAYGGGLRANLASWDESGVYLGLDAQYLRFDTGIDNVNISSTNYSSVSGDFTVDQWQVSLFMVKEFFQVTFYGGGDYSDSSVKYNYDTSGQSGNNKGENEYVVGALAGVNVHITDEVIFFTEGHFIDETSISFGLNARF